MGVRPESIGIAADMASAAIAGQVRLVEQLGREAIFYVDAGPLQCVSSESGTGNVTVQVGHMTAISNAAAVGLSIQPRHAYLFSAGDQRTISARKSVLAD
jgi:multiple sugar transport system ATP-binding protein